MSAERWATFPAAGIALLPKLVCPLCWPAYAAIASALGLSFLIQAPYLFAITVVFLIFAVGFLSFRARQRHGYWPALLGLLGSVIILVGKFAFDSHMTLYCGVGIIMGASVWNAWPNSKRSCCPQARAAQFENGGISYESKTKC